MTIPSQDLTSLDLLLRDSRSKNSGTPGSMFLPSNSRHQQLEYVIRGGRTLGDARPPAAGAACSAFTSPESSPRRGAAEELSSSAAVAPARPEDHPATEPALSCLLSPPFNNSALRTEFIASLEQHLAEYEDRGRGEEVGRAGSDNGNAHAREDGDGGAGQGVDKVKRGGDSGTAAVAARDGGDTPAVARVGENDGKRNGNSSRAGSRRGVAMKNTDEGETAALKSEDRTIAALGNKAPDQREEQAKNAVHQYTVDDTEPGTTTSTNWAQEYHDYLCSKDS